MTCLHLVPNTGDELTQAARSASGRPPHLRLVASNGSRPPQMLAPRGTGAARRYHSWSSLLSAVGALGAAVSLMLVGYTPSVSLREAAAHLPISSPGPDPIDEGAQQNPLFHPAMPLRSDTR